MKSKIIQAALDLVAEGGLINLTKEKVCMKAGVSMGSFYHYTGITFREFLTSLIEQYGGESPDPVIRKRAEPKLRREQILAAAIRDADLQGFSNITRESVAWAANVSPGLVSKYFGTITYLREVVMARAIQTRELRIIAQGLAVADPLATRADRALQEEASASIVQGDS